MPSWSVPRRAWVEPEDMGLILECARLCFLKGDFKRAARLFEGAVAARPDLASAVACLAICNLKQGKRGRAIRLLRRALELDTAEPCALLTLGDLAMLDGDRETAAAWYKRCKAADEGGAWGRVARQAIADIRGDEDEDEVPELDD